MIPARYEQCLNKCKSMVQSSDIKSMCITSDCWTSRNCEGYMAVTMHFIDESFTPQHMLLTCRDFSERHTSENLARELKNILEDWNVSKRVSLAISDNAANIKKALEDLGLKHFGCFAHSLNLIVNSALNIPETQEMLTKIKKIVAHFKRSTTANSKLMQYQKNNGVAIIKKLLQDVPTRWNSTFYMLERFVELEDTIKATLALLDAPLPTINPQEWASMKELIILLRPFENATVTVSGQNYITGALVIVFVAGLTNVLNELETSEQMKLRLSLESLAILKQGIQTRFANVGEYSTTLAANAFLDPRFKKFPFQSVVAADQIKKKKIIQMVAKQISKTMKASTTTTPAAEGTQSSEEKIIRKAEEDKLTDWSALDKKVAVKQPTGLVKAKLS